MGSCCSSRRCVAPPKPTRRTRSQRSPQSKPNPWRRGAEACTRENTTRVRLCKKKKKKKKKSSLKEYEKFTIKSSSGRKKKLRAFKKKTLCMRRRRRNVKKTTPKQNETKQNSEKSRLGVKKINKSQRSSQLDKSVVNGSLSCVVPAFVKTPTAASPAPRPGGDQSEVRPRDASSAGFVLCVYLLYYNSGVYSRSGLTNKDTTSRNVHLEFQDSSLFTVTSQV